MKKTAAILAALTLLAGCTIFKTLPDYTPDPENVQTIQAHIENPVNIGEFADASYRRELTCQSLAILEAPDGQTYANVLRHALTDELAQAKRHDPASPVTITAQLNRIDSDTGKGMWIIHMTLASSNGKTMTIEQTHTYNSIGLGEAACIQAASHYLPAVGTFMKKLLASNEFAELTQNTPPPAAPENDSDTQGAVKADEIKAREAGRERIRQTDSLDTSRKSLMNGL